MPLCPVCNASINGTITPTVPFCSARCRLIDLGRWLDEGYGVPETRRSDDRDVEESEEIG